MRDEELELLLSNVKTDVKKEEEFNFNFDHLLNKQEIIANIEEYMQANKQYFDILKNNLVSKNRNERSNEAGRRGELPGSILGILGGLYFAYKNVENIHWGWKIVTYVGSGISGNYVGQFVGFAAGKIFSWTKAWAEGFEGDISSVNITQMKGIEFTVKQTIQNQVRSKLKEIRYQHELDQLERYRDFNEVEMLSALNAADETYIENQLEQVIDPVTHEVIHDPVSVEGRNYDRATLQGIWNINGLQSVTPFSRATLTNPANLPVHLPTRQAVEDFDNLQPRSFRDRVLKNRFDHARQ